MKIDSGVANAPHQKDAKPNQEINKSKGKSGNNQQTIHGRRL
jgi:hypothetical protein